MIEKVKQTTSEKLLLGVFIVCFKLSELTFNTGLDVVFDEDAKESTV